MNRPVRVHVGTLVVRGIDVTHPERLGPAVGTALADLIERRGTPDPHARAGRLRVGPVAVPASTNPEALGRVVATALYDGLVR
jgi:hypothetical protein